MVKVGEVWRRCGDWVSSSLSTAASSAGPVGRRWQCGDSADCGTACRSCGHCHAVQPYALIGWATTRTGLQTPAGQLPRDEVLLELVGEVSQSAQERIGREPLETAQTRRPGRRRRGPARAARRLAATGPSSRAEPSSYSRRTPMRHGMVLPHDSSDRKRVSSVAMSTRHVESSMTTIDATDPRSRPSRRAPPAV